jgi:CelD/BcsL family acetyltransferase involved in cellulose biosynthesis
VSTSGAWSDYRPTLGRGFRQSTKQGLTKLQRDHVSIRFAEAGTPEDVRQQLNTLIEHKIRQWREAKQAHIGLENTAVQRFYHDMAQCMFNAGWLRLPALVVDGQVAAINLGLEHDGKYYACQNAFNIVFEKYSAGRLLILHLLEDGFGRRLREFDMLAGGETYKFSYRPSVRKLFNATMFQTSLRGRAAEAWLCHLRPRLAHLAENNKQLIPLDRLVRRDKLSAG